MTPMILTRLIALIATGLTAGIFLGHRAGVSRASTRLAPGSFIQLQQIIHATFERIMPPLVIASVLGTAIWALLVRTHVPPAAFWLLLAATLGLVSAAGLTRTINIPINRQLISWNSEAPPAEFPQVWERWERIHTIRTVIVVAAFMCQAIALGGFNTAGS